ncbi:MAG: alpha/beta fold hydrolase [Bosea sp.]|nr:alpha/beta fold hydrolase [Bosea sp. (in: a-proteobacteria)]
MPRLFHNELHDEFGSWLYGYIATGGPEFGEIAALAEAVGEGDDAAYHAAFVAAGERAFAEAEAAERAGHDQSARENYLRASAIFDTSYHPLYGAPTDPRLVAAFRRQMTAMQRAFALMDPRPIPLAIPFEGATIHGWYLPAPKEAGGTAPLVVFTNGYDGTVTDMYFASAAAAHRRGYASLIFDGPGQGGMLYEQSVAMRPDWETVVSAVLDVAVTLPDVDPARIALSGWSFGGYLAPRAAASEPRIAALIADPLLPGLADGIRAMAMKFGATPEQAADLRTLAPDFIAAMDAVVRGNPSLDWKIVKRGFWVHGVDSLAAYLAEAEAYTLWDRLEAIRCPTLVTVGEEDSLAAGAPAAFEKLSCPKRMIRFAAAEGAGGHCEMSNRALLNRRTFDWLDEVFAGRFV